MAIVTASSRERVPILAVAEISALGVNRRAFDIVAHPLPEPGMDGLLGLDFLRDHKLIIDFVNGELELD